MIKSFRHKGLKDFFETGTLKGIQPKHAKRLEIILDLLNAAVDVKDVNFPGSNLHSLKGNRFGYWALSVSGNWRITFKFIQGHPCDVDYEDYH